MSNELTVLYEDADIAAVDKPSGLMAHSDGRSEGPFLTDWITGRFPGAVGVGEPARSHEGKAIDRSGIVHRLDRETSGVILVAKTQAGFDCLKGQFQDRTVAKRYLAFIWGKLDEEFGTIDRPIGRSANDFPKWSAQRGTRGEIRNAETYWTRLWTGETKVDENAERPEKFTLVEAEPKTGRTHQIRVHFLAIHHPIVSDTLYAPKRPHALGFTRTALHSRSIEFMNTEGKRVKVEAPLPADFQAAIRKLGITLIS